MQTKEEILRKYYSMGDDGLPEIAADGLLKAMEEYRLQAEEAAFNAGRQLAGPGASHLYATFQDYKAKQSAAPVEPDQTGNIQLIADSILEQFLPHDADVHSLTFNIRTDGKNYSVNYVKNQQGYWYFSGYSPAE